MLLFKESASPAGDIGNVNTVSVTKFASDINGKHPNLVTWVTYKGEPTNFSLNKGTAVHVNDLEDYNHIMLKKMKKKSIYQRMS